MELLDISTLSMEEEDLSEETDELTLANVGVQDITFSEFKACWGKRYSTAGEEKYRYQIFMANLAKVSEHNSNPLRTYNMKANQFLDVSTD